MAINASLTEQKSCYPCRGFLCQNMRFAVGKAQSPALGGEALPFPRVAVGQCRPKRLGARVSALKIKMEN